MQKYKRIFALCLCLSLLAGCKMQDEGQPQTTTPAVNAAASSAKAKSDTGRKPLPTVTFTAHDPQNTAGLPTKKIAFSYGVAKDGKPSEQTVANQAFFDEKGYRALAYDNKSTDKVIYLTFDCGYENGCTAKILDTLKEKRVPAAFFCTVDMLKTQPNLITRMIDEGHMVGNHSTTHPSFATIDRIRMAKELEDFDNYLRAHFGYSAPFFRFPMGEYNESALELVQSLGYTSVFWSAAYADWDTSKVRGADYAFDTVTARLHPGAILLLHAVSPDNADAMGSIIDWARQQGYTFQSL